MQIATELGISPSMLRNWRSVVHGGHPAVESWLEGCADQFCCNGVSSRSGGRDRTAAA